LLPVWIFFSISLPFASVTFSWEGSAGAVAVGLGIVVKDLVWKEIDLKEGQV